jgi:hypothetical protein
MAGRKELNMKSFTKFWSLGFLVAVVFTSGCLTWEAKIDDMRAVYSEPDNLGVPKVIITDLSDGRSDTTLVGRIAALNLSTKTPVNVIITNRIASKLKYAGFNIQKINVTGNKSKSELESKSELAAVVKRNNAKLLFTGRLDHFFIASSDAILETAKGRVSFRIDILNEQGQSLFYRTYTANTEKHIGLGGGQASEEFIEKTINTAINKLFKDAAFQQFLLKAKSE